MEGIGKGLGCLLISIGVIGLAFGVSITVGFWKIASSKGIESSKRILPEIRLTTDGKKVDTLFIYKEPK